MKGRKKGAAGKRRQRGDGRAGGIKDGSSGRCEQDGGIHTLGEGSKKKGEKAKRRTQRL